MENKLGVFEKFDKNLIVYLASFIDKGSRVNFLACNSVIMNLLLTRLWKPWITRNNDLFYFSKEEEDRYSPWHWRISKRIENEYENIHKSCGLLFAIHKGYFDYYKKWRTYAGRKVNLRWQNAILLHYAFHKQSILFVTDLLKERSMTKHRESPFEVIWRLLYVTSRKPLTDPTFAEYIFTHDLFNKYRRNIGGLLYEKNPAVLQVYLKHNKLNRSSCSIYQHHFISKNYDIIDILIDNNVPPNLEVIAYAAFENQWDYALKLLLMTEYQSPEFEAVLQERTLFTLIDYWRTKYPTQVSYFAHWENIKICKERHAQRL